MAPRNIIRNTMRTAAQAAFGRPRNVMPKWKTPATQEDIAQGTADITSLLGGGAGLFLGPEGKEKATESFHPLIRPIMALLAKLGIDPYSKWRKTIRHAADLSVPGRAGPAYYSSMANQMRSYFADPRGGKRTTAAGHKPLEQAQALEYLAGTGMLPYYNNPQAISQYLGALGSISEVSGTNDIKTNAKFLENLIGSPGSYRPQQLEMATRAAILGREGAF